MSGPNKPDHCYLVNQSWRVCSLCSNRLSVNSGDHCCQTKKVFNESGQSRDPWWNPSQTMASVAWSNPRSLTVAMLASSIGTGHHDSVWRAVILSTVHGIDWLSGRCDLSWCGDTTSDDPIEPFRMQTV